jgi:uncharacterized protein YybS (DUF2232 family)
MPDIASLLLELAILAIMFGVLDLLILFMIRKNVKWTMIITAGTAYLAVIFFAFYMMMRSAGTDIIASMMSDFRASLDASLKTALGSGASAETVENTRKQAEYLVIRTMPAWWFITALFMVFLNYMVTRLFAAKRYGINSAIPPFEMWYMGEPAMWIFLAAISVLVFTKFIPQPWVFDAGLNVAFVMANVYFLIGLSVISFLFKKYKLPPILQFMIILMVVFWIFLSIIIILAGIFDTWFNFRKIEKGGAIWR